MKRDNGGIVGVVNTLTPTFGSGSWSLFEQARYRRANTWPSYDPLFNLTTLLLRGNGTNGAQNNTFLDSSSNNFSITRNGNTTQGTFTPFSQTGWSVQFERADFNNLLVASSSDFNFGSGDFTIEFWINPQYLPVAGDQSFHYVFDTGNVVAFFYSGTLYFRGAGGVELVSPVAHGMSNGVWYHLAYVRSGSNYSVFRNGLSISTGSGGTITSAASPLTIGGSAGYNGITACTISNFRVTKGQALYTSAFTPATETLTTTSQGATASNVKLLTAQSNRFVDNSTDNPKTIQLGSGGTVGNRFIQAFSPFLPGNPYDTATNGGAAFFDGTGDYLSLPNNAAFSGIGSDDWTVEAWIYTTAASTSQTIMSISGAASAFAAIRLEFSNTNTLYLLCSKTGAAWDINYQAGTMPANAWNHVAATRSGTNVRLYINGAQVGVTQTLSGSLLSGTVNRIGIAPNDTSGAFVGYISGARYIRGTALYTGTTYTVPTAPFTAITNTQLLCNFTNAGITDATAKIVLETTGNAQISTTQSKWGSGSMYFDGTGDALAIPASQKENFRFGANDFTVEFWAWKSANGSAGYDTVISIGNDGNFSGGFSVELSNTRGFCLVYDAAVRISASMNPNDSAWHHYAVVRNGSTFALYRDGLQLTTGTLTPTLGITGNGFVGAGGSSSGSNFNGYINDLRVTKGFARYTSSFTPPSGPYPLR